MDNLTGARLSVVVPRDPLCVIVKFRADLIYGRDVPQPPACLFQVTVRSDKLSPEGALIRFGETQGDELMGWMRRDYLEVVEVLGAVDLSTGRVSPLPLEARAA